MMTTEGNARIGLESAAKQNSQFLHECDQKIKGVGLSNAKQPGKCLPYPSKHTLGANGAIPINTHTRHLWLQNHPETQDLLNNPRYTWGQIYQSGCLSLSCLV